jgi:DNA-binding MarR family transcriptional regulator
MKAIYLCASMKTSGSRFAQCLYFTSAALARKVERIAQESWKPVDLSPSHAYLLLAVLEEPGVQPGVLARELQLQPSTITRLIEKLEEKKLVVRTTEGKLTNVYPTPKARELQPRMKDCMETFHQRYSAAIGEEECGRMVRNMARIADKLEP